MHARTTLTAALAAATLMLVAPAAQAATVDRFDRSAFDSTPVTTDSGYAMSGATAGELPACPGPVRDRRRPGRPHGRAG